MIRKPQLHADVHINGASTAASDATEEPAVIGGQGCNASLTAPGCVSVGFGEGRELGAVVHPRTMRYAYRVVNGTDTAFKTVNRAGIIPHMEKSLADRIDQRLKELGLSSNAASVMAGRSRDFIRNIKRGLSQIPQGDNLLALAKVLQVPPEFFDPDYVKSGTTLPSSAGNRLPELTERRLKAISDLSDLSPEEEESFLEELEAMARAARARRQRGGRGRS